MWSIFLTVLVVAHGKGSDSGSPVQKVIELLNENKVKVLNDLKAEEGEMAEYTKYCDEMTSEKTYAMATADRTMAGLSATIEDVDAQVAGLGEDIKALGTEIANKDKDLMAATTVRKIEKTDFAATEKELSESVDQLERAIVQIKRGTALVQSSSNPKVDPKKAMKAAMTVFSEIVDAGRVSAGMRRKLQNLVQTTGKDGEDEYEKLGQPQAKVEAYSSSSGGILGELTSMKEKAEETLSDTRMTEMKKQHNFDTFAQGLTDAIKIANEKLADSKKTAATLTEESGKAKGELVNTQKTKAADEKFLASLTSDCKEAAAGWEERQESARGELNAINKAIEVLSEGVKVFMLQTHKRGDFDSDDAVPQSPADETRQKLVQKLKSLSSKFSSYALMEVAGAAAADPFEKVKGLIEGMIAKLVTEANEEATQKGFCDEEKAKSDAAKDEKTMTIDQLSSRMDKASATVGLLDQKVKTLEAEIAALDKGNAEATKIRNEEHTTYLKASSDFKLASEAVEKAIKVLKEYYSSSLLQTGARKSSGKQPEFGGAKSDSASTIISILEMAGENFTKMLMETETDESEAAAAYETLMQDNKVSKVTKSTEIKGALSEIKSLDVALKNHKEDYDMTSKELSAVMEYLDKLKPQCEAKAMTYGEKKARREAEIDGLKQALSILEGGALLQKSVKLHLRH
eukprot:gnl/MRDRNA2_/MRDRNA2_89119_c0_seq1.p1 gnl/MRDRNA2_/MRDRNA2_89119_c0~~gnl/MRDRNA2_/MRDRNA2_89119_c0_seq1.p1  ORF type:complete len:687 (-),score=227.03 gnl/MRDRNA2_/MRDRNA2_89119_c0_seq1:86-2146(-)